MTVKNLLMDFYGITIDFKLGWYNQSFSNNEIIKFNNTLIIASCNNNNILISINGFTHTISYFCSVVKNYYQNNYYWLSIGWDGSSTNGGFICYSKFNDPMNLESNCYYDLAFGKDVFAI